MPLPLATVFADVPDPPRDTENKLHLLTDILTIATCAIIAGADGWEQIAAYGEAKKAFFGRFLELPNWAFVRDATGTHRDERVFTTATALTPARTLVVTFSNVLCVGRRWLWGEAVLP